MSGTKPPARAKKKAKKFRVADLKVNDRVRTWFSDQPDGKSTILGIRPYTGAYPQFFSWVFKLTAPRTHAGWTEMAVGESTFTWRDVE
jgi:hypothetical protein